MDRGRDAYHDNVNWPSNYDHTWTQLVMILAIVGSIHLAGNPEAYRIIDEVIDKYKPAMVISGGAVGIDSMAVERAKAHGILTHEFFPKVKRWHDGFRPRNLQIAKECDALVRIALKGSKTYGSGWTRDRAAELGKPTEEFIIDPKI